VDVLLLHVRVVESLPAQQGNSVSNCQTA
jgi:hypothetical protein